ncbi:hypothetical protein Aperf_G00000055258 [Anoplocephala perfoliata]
MTTLQCRNCSILPDTATAQNAVALFIFTIPMGTISQDLFVNPLYGTVRNNIAKRCQCELTVFDGNTMGQRSHSSPNSTRNRIRDINGNAVTDGTSNQASTGLLINITNLHEQVLYACGNWLIQVAYLTEPSEHHLFLKLVNDFATKLKNFNGVKRRSGSLMISQGFKFTTLVALTHEKLRDALQRGGRRTPTDRNEGKSGMKQERLAGEERNLYRQDGELPMVRHQHSFDDMESHNSTMNKFKLCQSGDLNTDEILELEEERNSPKTKRRVNNRTDVEHNLNRNGNCKGCIEELEALEVEDNNFDNELVSTMTENCLRLLERKIGKLVETMEVKNL